MRQGGAATGFAVQHHLQIGHLARRVAAELKLQQAARYVHGAGQMALAKLVGFAHIDQHLGLGNGGFGLW